MKQGGYGIAVRNPIYLKDENGQEYFWGFTIVILRVPDIFQMRQVRFRNLDMNKSFQNG